MTPRLETAKALRPALLRLAIFTAAVLAPAAASAATAGAYISVTVPRYLSMGMTSGMSFGAVVPNGCPGEVELSPTGEMQGTNVDLSPSLSEGLSTILPNRRTLPLLACQMARQRSCQTVLERWPS